MKIECDTLESVRIESVYGDDDKYIETKIKSYNDCMLTNFQSKKCQKKKHHASVYQ